MLEFQGKFFSFAPTGQGEKGDKMNIRLANINNLGFWLGVGMCWSAALLGSEPVSHQPQNRAGKAQAGSAECLTLHNGRFQVTANFHDRAGGTLQPAGAVSLRDATGFDETGYFWFDDPDKIDLVVRVFDGCQFNQHFWVFYGSLTNVSYDLAVTDTQTDLVKTYSNPLGKISPPIQDTEAFATCPSPHPAPADFELAATGGADKREDLLLLQQDRFRLEVDWAIPGEGTGRGTVGFAIPKSGAFWFLDQSDLNLYVQIFDNRPVNGHFGLAYTSFTGAEYTLRVTDTQSGLVRTYENPLEESTFGIDGFLDENPDSGLLYPWVSNNSNFDSTLVINNNNCLDADVTLEGARENGETQTITRTIPPLGFLEEAASDLFPELGTGPGYSVLLSSNVPGVRGRWVTNNRITNSPSQGVAIQIPDQISLPVPPNANVGGGLLFGYLPVSGDFISAPVVVNVGDAPTDVSLYFYNRQGSLIGSDLESGRGLEPNRPFARVTSDLLPGQSDNLSMVAYSPDQPLTGVVFVFNSDGEPAIGNATAIDFTPPQ